MQQKRENIKDILKQGVALTGRRNTTGPPCSVCCPTAHAPGRRRADRPRDRRPAGPNAGSIPTLRSHEPGAGRPLAAFTDDDRRWRQTTKDDGQQTILAH